MLFGQTICFGVKPVRIPKRVDWVCPNCKQTREKLIWVDTTNVKMCFSCKMMLVFKEIISKGIGVNEETVRAVARMK